MKTYNVKLLTQKGVIEKQISEDQNMEQLSEEVQKTHGAFVTLSSTEIKKHPHPIIDKILEDQSKDLYNRNTEQMIDLYSTMLSGKDNKEYRREIIEAIKGEKVLSKDASYSNLIQCFKDYFNTPIHSEEPAPEKEEANYTFMQGKKSPAGYQVDLFVNL